MEDALKFTCSTPCNTYPDSQENVFRLTEWYIFDDYGDSIIPSQSSFPRSRAMTTAGKKQKTAQTTAKPGVMTNISTIAWRYPLHQTTQDVTCSFQTYNFSQLLGRQYLFSMKANKNCQYMDTDHLWNCTELHTVIDVTGAEGHQTNRLVFWQSAHTEEEHNFFLKLCFKEVLM